MKLLTFSDGPSFKLGLHTEHGVADVAAAAAALGLTGAPTAASPFFAWSDAGTAVLRLIASRAASSAGAPWLLNENEITFGPCLLNPEKIICVGLNYRRHAAESGLPVPENPVLFAKYANTLAAHGEEVPLPPVAERYDYEVELGVVIGKTARNVPVERALEYVGGYCTGNDLSARDLQSRTSQWLQGKTLDKFMPVGPYLVTSDEVPDPQALRMRCWVNGDLRQDSNTSDMIFSVAEVVSYASRFMTLKPGDFFTTGTPEGVILGHKDPVWLKPGDEVTVEIEKLGRLTNKLVAG